MSLAGMSASESEYDTEYGYTESNLCEVLTRPELQEELAHADLNTPSVLRPVKVLLEDDDKHLILPSPMPVMLKRPSEKGTLHGKNQTQTTFPSSPQSIYENPFNDPHPHTQLHFSSPATDITPMRALPNAPFTPSNQNLRPPTDGYNSGASGSTYSLSREVRLREAAKQHDILLSQERNRDQSDRYLVNTIPILHPSPIALKVAAQLIRDSPAGKLPIGSQAVLSSKSFWGGLAITQIGLISLTAAVTATVRNPSSYGLDAAVGTANIFWLSVSIVAVLGGGVLTATAYLRKMGYCLSSRTLLKHGGLGVFDQIMHAHCAHQQEEAELGSMPRSVQTLSSLGSTPVQRGTGAGGLYTSHARYMTSNTFRTMDSEWQELYMTPEQLRERILRGPHNSRSTPSKPSIMKSEPIRLSTRQSLGEFTTVRLDPMILTSPHFKSTPGTPSPFNRFPEPVTPHISAINQFSSLGSQESCNEMHLRPASRDINKVEVDNWSPLENLTRDINSEHVRNMPIEDRHRYISQRRILSEDRARKIRESLERISIRSRRNSEGGGSTSTLPPTITEVDEPRGRSRHASYELVTLVHEEPQVLSQDSMKMLELGLDPDTDVSTGMSSARAEPGFGPEMTSPCRRRASGASLEKMKKTVASTTNPFFTELNGRNVGAVVKEKIDRLREVSEKGLRRK
jgi:hypothetical protein